MRDLLKEKEKELEKEKVRCAELEKKLKSSEEGFGSDDSDMEESGVDESGISNKNPISAESSGTPADPNLSSSSNPNTTNDIHQFVKPNPVAISPKRTTNAGNKNIEAFSTPARNSNALPPTHGINTPASNLASVVASCNIKTPLVSRNPRLILIQIP